MSPLTDMHCWNTLPFTFFCLLLSHCITGCASCGPGSSSLRSSRHWQEYRAKPLREKQFVPNIDESSVKASGRPEGKILRKSQRFRDLLVRVDSRNIIFGDEERTGADHYMTRRCKVKLEILAVLVRNEWPGVKLFVTEAFDENYEHKKQSLHYEGRAVDVKTDDGDRKKYGILGRLAVQAGFDWVFYGSKAHIHVSCRTENLGNLTDAQSFRKDSEMLGRETSSLQNTTAGPTKTPGTLGKPSFTVSNSSVAEKLPNASPRVLNQFLNVVSFLRWN